MKKSHIAAWMLVVALIIADPSKHDVGPLEPQTHQISSANIPAEPFSEPLWHVELPEHTHRTVSDFVDENNFEPTTSMASAVVKLTMPIDNFFRPRTRQAAPTRNERSSPTREESYRRKWV